MADGRRYALTPQLDVNQLLMEAKQRWLRPAEICGILENYRNFHISPEPPSQPPSGSLFLFDRKVLRYFRKDGHNWKKKNDGKTVKEAHERLKSGSVDVLHCYYAHGEDNDNFQRRSYWMLKEELMHIVLVHYLEVKGGRSSGRSKGMNEILPEAHMNSPGCSTSLTNYSQLPSQVTDGESQLSGHNSEYEDAESDFNSARSGYNINPQMQQYGVGYVMNSPLQNPLGLASSIGNLPSLDASTTNSDVNFDVGENISGFSTAEFDLTFDMDKVQHGYSQWEQTVEVDPTDLGVSLDPFAASANLISIENHLMEPFEGDELYMNEIVYKDSSESSSGVSSWELPSAVGEHLIESDHLVAADGSISRSNKNLSFGIEDAFDIPCADQVVLQKHDSFSRWVSNELGVANSDINSISGPHWNSIEPERVIEDSTREQIDPYRVNPVLSQDQLYSIADISPSWAYAGRAIKVLISGKFLKNVEEMGRHKLSCMFGEVEVPVEVLPGETLSCFAPPHEAETVDIYITCSNRSACSEVRQFVFRSSDAQLTGMTPPYSTGNEMNFRMQFDRLLMLNELEVEKTSCNHSEEEAVLCRKITYLMREDDEWSNLLRLFDEDDFSFDSPRDLVAENLLKEKLHRWLTYKVTEGGRGPNILNENGQGVIHLAAALNYDWAIRPTVIAGVNVNFRDARGWTALHWAAWCGKERAVVALVALGADCGALTDPTLGFHSGRPPADLASEMGHKGIAGFLAESSLINHLQNLTIKDLKGQDIEVFHDSLPGIDDLAEDRLMMLSSGDLHAESLKESLAAVRKATQAAARIYQVYRLQSFRRKQAVEYSDDASGIPDVRSIQIQSTGTSSKFGRHDGSLHIAATRIQNRFRGWKGRKDFLHLRQSVVKIQAHFRGHQVRKQYRKVIWSVMIMEKVILRWRRKKPGLRGYQPEGLIEGSSSQSNPADDDYDFLYKGRKETEERLAKALNRVKSMVQYPQARDQYRRLITVVTQLKESQAAQDKAEQDRMAGEDVDDSDFMIVKEFLEDTPMPGF